MFATAIWMAKRWTGEGRKSDSIKRRPFHVSGRKYGPKIARASACASLILFAAGFDSVVAQSAPLVDTEMGGISALERERLSGTCRGFDFSGKVADGYFVQHGGGKVKVRIPVAYLLFPETGSSFTAESDGEANFNFHRDTLKPYLRQEMFGKIAAGKEEWISFLVTNLVEIDVVARNLMNFFSQRSILSHEPAFPEKAALYHLMQVQLPELQQPD